MPMISQCEVPQKHNLDCTLKIVWKSWTHARSNISGISARSRGNKDQSGLSYRLHYRDTLSPPSAGQAQSNTFTLLVDTG